MVYRKEGRNHSPLPSQDFDGTKYFLDYYNFITPTLRIGYVNCNGMNKKK